MDAAGPYSPPARQHERRAGGDDAGGSPLPLPSPSGWSHDDQSTTMGGADIMRDGAVHRDALGGLETHLMPALVREEASPTQMGALVPAARPLDSAASRRAHTGGGDAEAQGGDAEAQGGGIDKRETLGSQEVSREVVEGLSGGSSGRGARAGSGGLPPAAPGDASRRGQELQVTAAQRPRFASQHRASIDTADGTTPRGVLIDDTSQPMGRSAATRAGGGPGVSKAAAVAVGGRTETAPSSVVPVPGGGGMLAARHADAPQEGRVGITKPVLARAVVRPRIDGDGAGQPFDEDAVTMLGGASTLRVVDSAAPPAQGGSGPQRSDSKSSGLRGQLTVVFASEVEYQEAGGQFQARRGMAPLAPAGGKAPRTVQGVMDRVHSRAVTAAASQQGPRRSRRKHPTPVSAIIARAPTSPSAIASKTGVDVRLDLNSGSGPVRGSHAVNGKAPESDEVYSSLLVGAAVPPGAAQLHRRGSQTYGKANSGLDGDGGQLESLAAVVADDDAVASERRIQYRAVLDTHETDRKNTEEAQAAALRRAGGVPPEHRAARRRSREATDAAARKHALASSPRVNDYWDGLAELSDGDEPLTPTTDTALGDSTELDAVATTMDTSKGSKLKSEREMFGDESPPRTGHAIDARKQAELAAAQGSWGFLAESRGSRETRMSAGAPGRGTAAALGSADDSAVRKSVVAFSLSDRPRWSKQDELEYQKRMKKEQALRNLGIAIFRPTQTASDAVLQRLAKDGGAQLSHIRAVQRATETVAGHSARALSRSATLETEKFRPLRNELRSNLAALANELARSAQATADAASANAAAARSVTSSHTVGPERSNSHRTALTSISASSNASSDSSAVVSAAQPPIAGLRSVLSGNDSHQLLNADGGSSRQGLMSWRGTGSTATLSAAANHASSTDGTRHEVETSVAHSHAGSSKTIASQHSDHDSNPGEVTRASTAQVPRRSSLSKSRPKSAPLVRAGSHRSAIASSKKRPGSASSAPPGEASRDKSRRRPRHGTWAFQSRVNRAKPPPGRTVEVKLSSHMYDTANGLDATKPRAQLAVVQFEHQVGRGPGYVAPASKRRGGGKGDVGATPAVYDVVPGLDATRPRSASSGPAWSQAPARFAPRGNRMDTGLIPEMPVGADGSLPPGVAPREQAGGVPVESSAEATDLLWDTMDDPARDRALDRAEAMAVLAQAAGHEGNSRASEYSAKDLAACLDYVRPRTGRGTGPAWGTAPGRWQKRGNYFDVALRHVHALDAAEAKRAREKAEAAAKRAKSGKSTKRSEGYVVKPSRRRGQWLAQKQDYLRFAKAGSFERTRITTDGPLNASEAHAQEQERRRKAKKASYKRHRGVPSAAPPADPIARGLDFVGKRQNGGVEWSRQPGRFAKRGNRMDSGIVPSPRKRTPRPPKGAQAAASPSPGPVRTAATPQSLTGPESEPRRSPPSAPAAAAMVAADRQSEEFAKLTFTNV